MIHTVNDFFNKMADDIRSRFFPDVKHCREDRNCETATYAIELFNNGCLTYRAFIGRLSKACNTNNATIHNIAERHIISFGQYQYKPRRLYSQAKKQLN